MEAHPSADHPMARVFNTLLKFCDSRGDILTTDWGARWLSGRASDYEARVEVQNPTPPCCVIEQDTLLSESTGNTQEAVALSRHD